MDASTAPASLIDCPVVESRAVGGYRLISFVAPELAEAARPGQFVMVRRAGLALDPLLPRPMGIHDIDADLVKLLVEPVGKGSGILADSRVGDRLAVLGPLGNGFDIEGGAPAIIAGGGIGVSPLAFLATALKARSRRVRCFLGFRHRRQAVAAELFREVALDIFTEDGSLGRQGLISEALDGCLKETIESGQEPELFACGPDAMLAVVARAAELNAVPAQVSAAAHMACGVGACQGCVIETRGGYRKVCSDGPVFDARELIWPT